MKELMDMIVSQTAVMVKDAGLLVEMTNNFQEYMQEQYPTALNPNNQRKLERLVADREEAIVARNRADILNQNNKIIETNDWLTSIELEIDTLI